MSTTIICCTDNACPPDIFRAAQRHLQETAGEIPLVVVSHLAVPVRDGDTNIVIGRQKRSWLTLYRQLYEGMKATDSDTVVICEHDCFYTEEHLNWQPPRNDTFYYNEHCLLVQWSDDHNRELNGMYSRWRTQRLALSQLICNRRLYLETIERRLNIIDKDREAFRLIDQLGEPGVSKINKKKAQYWAASGRSVYLKDMLGEVLELERYETFETVLPNLDVRHGQNFTGPKRGRNRHYNNQHWGKFEDLLCHT